MHSKWFLFLVLSMFQVEVKFKVLSSITENGRNIFVLFHNPFCLASQKAEFEFKQLKEEPLAKFSVCPNVRWTSPIKFIQHDIKASPADHMISPKEEYLLLEQFKVDTFPAVRLYVDGQLYIYEGEWSANAMAKWLFKKLEVPFCILPSKSTLNKFLKNSVNQSVALIFEDQLSESLLQSFKQSSYKHVKKEKQSKQAYYDKLYRTITSLIKIARTTGHFDFGITSKSLFLDVVKQHNLTTERLESQILVVKSYMENNIIPWTGDLILDYSVINLINFFDQIDNLKIFNFSSSKRYDILLRSKYCIIYIDNPKNAQNFENILNIFSSVIKNNLVNQNIVFSLAETSSEATVRLMRYFALDFLTDIPKIIALENNETSQQAFIPEDVNFAKELSNEKLIQFILSVKQGKMPSYVKSERTCSFHNSDIYSNKNREKTLLEDLTTRSLTSIIEKETSAITIILFYSLIKENNYPVYTLFRSASGLYSKTNEKKQFLKWAIFNVDNNENLENGESVPQIRVFFPRT